MLECMRPSTCAQSTVMPKVPRHTQSCAECRAEGSKAKQLAFAPSEEHAQPQRKPDVKSPQRMKSVVSIMDKRRMCWKLWEADYRLRKCVQRTSTSSSRSRVKRADFFPRGPGDAFERFRRLAREVLVTCSRGPGDSLGRSQGLTRDQSLTLHAACIQGRNPHIGRLQVLLRSRILMERSICLRCASVVRACVSPTSG